MREISRENDDARHSGKHIDPKTGIWPISEWGAECARGFSRNERFGGTRVIAGANCQITRKWRALATVGNDR